MTITHRAKIVIVAILLFLLLVILLVLFWPEKQDADIATNEEESQEEQVNQNIPPDPEPDPEPSSEEVRTEATVQVVAKIFVERYGSYSSESNLANIEDVLGLCTASYREELQDFVREEREDGAPESYYGVSTRVISTRITSMNNETATLEVLTQREESRGSIQETDVAYQTIVLEMQREGETWKVNNATWQN